MLLAESQADADNTGAIPSWSINRLAKTSVEPNFEREMKAYFILLLSILALCGWASADLPAFTFESDKTEAGLSINQNQKGFFILRYQAYRGSHRLGPVNTN